MFITHILRTIDDIGQSFHYIRAEFIDCWEKETMCVSLAYADCWVCVYHGRCSSSAHHIFLRKTVCSLSISAVLIEITSEENLLWRTYLRTCYIWACVVCASGTVFNATIWSYINHESWWYFGKWYEVYCRTGDISHILHSVNAQIEWQFSSKVWLDNNKSERRFKNVFNEIELLGSSVRTFCHR